MDFYPEKKTLSEKDIEKEFGRTWIWTALYETVNVETFEKTGKRSRPKKDVIKIDEEIDYAVIHKTRENGTKTKVEKRIVYGNEKRIEDRLKKTVSNSINTSYIERTNVTLTKVEQRNIQEIRMRETCLPCLRQASAGSTARTD